MKHITVTADSPSSIIFAANVRRERQGRGLLQDELGALAGYGRSHLSHVETGRRAPTLYTVDRIAKALGVPPSSLLVFHEPGGGS
jgi:transcriptional regulator with XRE-family HTH domain